MRLNAVDVRLKRTRADEKKEWLVNRRKDETGEREKSTMNGEEERERERERGREKEEEENKMSRGVRLRIIRRPY